MNLAMNWIEYQICLHNTLIERDIKRVIVTTVDKKSILYKPSIIIIGII